ncbi:MAG: hypothetical protein V1701_08160 [Planctomycetota bacterium]
MMKARMATLSLMVLLMGILALGYGGLCDSGSSNNDSGSSAPISSIGRGLVVYESNYVTSTMTASLFSRPADGSGTPTTLAASILCGQWSITKDDNKVVYVHSAGTGLYGYNVVNIDGTNPLTLTVESSFGYNWDVTDDSSKLIYSNADSSLNMVPVSGAFTETLASNVNGWEVTLDSTRVVYVDNYSSGTGRLQVADISGVTPVTATLVSSTNGSFDVTPDSTKVVYGESSGAVKVIPILGGSPVTLSSTSILPYVTPNSAKVIFMETNYDLKIIPIGGGTATNIDSNINQMYFQVSADSGWAIYPHDFNGFTSTLVSASLGSTPLTATLDSGIPFHSARITPAGNKVVYQTNFNLTTGLADLKVIPINGGTITSLVSGIGTMSWGITPDSTKILYLDNYDNNTQTGTLKVIPVSGGSPITLATGVPSGFGTFAATR